MTPRARTVWGTGLGLAAGVALATLWLRTAPAPERVPLPSEPQSEAPSAPELREELERARAERDRLAAALETLREAAAAQAALPERLEEAGQATARAPAPGEVFDEAGLRQIGWAESEITRLRERWDALELERLYLGDRARREGWEGSPRHREELARLWRELRAELGDDDYDALLYASGRGNRVVVFDVLAGSAAEAAGIQTGDVLRSYADRPLFEVTELLDLSRAGRPGASTEIRVLRGGEELRLFAPRGPLGVRVRSERHRPDPLR